MSKKHEADILPRDSKPNPAADFCAMLRTEFEQPLVDGETEVVVTPFDGYGAKSPAGHVIAGTSEQQPTAIVTNGQLVLLLAKQAKVIADAQDARPDLWGAVMKLIAAP